MGRRFILVAFLSLLFVVVTHTVSLASLENIKLRKVVSGSIAGAGNEITSKQLFKGSSATVVFAVRRPG